MDSGLVTSLATSCGYYSPDVRDLCTFGFLRCSQTHSPTEDRPLWNLILLRSLAQMLLQRVLTSDHGR